MAFNPEVLPKNIPPRPTSPRFIGPKLPTTGLPVGPQLPHGGLQVGPNPLGGARPLPTLGGPPKPLALPYDPQATAAHNTDALLKNAAQNKATDASSASRSVRHARRAVRPAMPSGPAIELGTPAGVTSNPAQAGTAMTRSGGLGRLGGLGGGLVGNAMTGAGLAFGTGAVAGLMEDVGLVDPKTHNAILDSNNDIEEAPRWYSIHGDEAAGYPQNSPSTPNANRKTNEDISGSSVSALGNMPMDEQINAAGMNRYAGRDDQGRVAFEGPRIMNSGGRTILTNVGGDEALRIVNNSHVRTDLPAYKQGATQNEQTGEWVMEYPTDLAGKRTGPPKLTWQGRTGGKVYDIGAPMRGSSFGAVMAGLGQMKAEARAEDRAMKYQNENRRAALEDARFGLDEYKQRYAERKDAREALRQGALDDANIAHSNALAKYYESQSAAKPTVEEAERARRINEIQKQLGESALDPAYREALMQALAILDPMYMYKPPIEAKPDTPFWRGGFGDDSVKAQPGALTINPNYLLGKTGVK